MAFKDLHKLKKIAVVEKETINVSHLVVGKDIFALSLYNDLKSTHGALAVRLLSEDAILNSDLLPKGPSSIRGEVNQKIFEEMFSHVPHEKVSDNALFYKDMAWKNFGGRSKPEVLKYDEEFFTGGRIDPDFTTVFELLAENEDFLAKVNQEAYQVKIKAIRRESAGFIVECINGTEFHCQHLYFGLSPYHYLQFYSEKNQLSDLFIQFCESTKTSSALFVKFVFGEKPLSDLKETIFIPLSYTHGWGHFVGEFKTVNGVQEIEFMHFMEDHLMSEEDVSRVIRLLKKSMEKIFENFLKNNPRDFIALEQEIGCLKIDDQLFETALESGKGEMNNLTFVGINAPLQKKHRDNSNIEDSMSRVSGVVRGLLSLSSPTKKFE